MPPQVIPPRESYIVVVSGAMNPQVHTPQFYRTIGAMDEDELQASLKIPENTTSAAMSQFRYGILPITVSCQPTQWWIQATNAAFWERMIAITTRVFTQLGATPVSGFALASQRHIDTGVDVKQVFAEQLTKLELGFPAGVSTSSSMELAVTVEDYIVGAIMQPSVLGERLVYGLYQCEYKLPDATPGTLVQIGASIQSRLEKFLLGSNHYFDTAVSAISTKGERG